MKLIIDKIFKIKRIFKTIFRFNKFKIDEDFILIIEHDDYLLGLGGVQKYIYEQTSYLVDSGVHVINIFPYKLKLFSRTLNLYGIYLNKCFYGYYTINFIINTVIKNDNLISVFLHHLKGWNKKDYTILLKYLKEYDIEKKLFIHDFYYITPSIDKVYSNLDEFYNVNDEFELIDFAPNNDIKEWNEAFNILFDTFKEIVVPSEYFRNVICKNITFYNSNIKVIPHLKLKEYGKRSIGNNEVVRIAFLGYKALFKGWNTWEKILNNCKNLDYQFYHIGSRFNKIEGNVQYMTYSYKDNGINTAPIILNNNKIDIVILWSLLPESYSYTFYEAIASGCFIITSKLSGNIAYEVNRLGTDFGIVLDNEESLISLLNDRSRLMNLICNKKKTLYEIQVNYK